MSDRRITYGETKSDPLKELASRIMKLSYTDMKKFVDVFNAKNGTSNTADRLVQTAEHLLGDAR